MTHVQKFLREGGSLAGLRALYAINSRRHERYPNLVSLKYNQIESPFAEPIVRECRGIVLDEANDWVIVARGFDKFFNHGEGHAAQIDWNSATVQEKVDGSLCVLYHYDGVWHVATTGTPDACGDVNGSGITFASYFWRTARECGMQLPSNADECFMLELTGPANRVVVPHARPSLTVLGMRDRVTGQERSAKVAADMLGLPAVRSFSLRSIDDVMGSFATMSPLAQEGYVIADQRFNRIKVKHPGYVALHHAKDGMSQRAIVEIARSGETSEVLVAFPELRATCDEARSRIDTFVLEVEEDYARLAGTPDQKTFALYAKETRCSAALFALRSKKVTSVREWFAGVNIDLAMRLLGYKVTT